MPTVKFGFRVPATGPSSSVERMSDSARLAEELGYYSGWIQDHISNTFERHKQYPVGMGSYNDPTNTLEPMQFETISTFSWLAGIAQKLHFATGIMPILLRDPIILGKQIATLDAISGSRFILGVGVSNVTDKPEYKAVGRPLLSYAQRYEMLGEYIAAMREIWTKPYASFHGKYVNFDDLCVYPKPPHPHVPVLVGCYTLAGGIQRPAVKFAIDHADGWNGGLLNTPEGVKSLIEDFKVTAKQAGKDLSKFEWCLSMRVSIGTTEAEAREASAWITDIQTSMSQYAGYMHKEKETWRTAKGGDAAPKSNVETAAVGTPSDILKAAEAYVDAGVTHISVWFMYPRYDIFVRQMKLFSKEVISCFN